MLCKSNTSVQNKTVLSTFDIQQSGEWEYEIE